MDKLEGMWVALTAYQQQADAAGHGAKWARMCKERTADAAYYAAIFATNAANAEKWARHVIEDINRVLEEKT